MNLDYEHIVIGAGIEGSSTAYYLAKDGKKTLLIDQYSLESSKGSSQGSSRIIRRAYAEEYYSCLMNEAYSEWHKLEKAGDQRLFTKTGLLVISSPPHKLLDQYISTFQKFKHVHEVLDYEELGARFPALNYGSGYRAVYDPDAGILHADQCLRTIQNLYRSLGGKVAENEEVLNIEPKGSHVKIQTANGVYTAASVVICAGPWATQLLPKVGINLPLTAKHVGVFYWPADGDQYSCENFPDIMDISNDFEVYSLPAMEYPKQMKVCCSYVGPGDEFDPTLKKPFDHSGPEAILKPYIKQHFPKLHSTPSIKLDCYFTMTPDKACVLDHHPQHKNIVIGCGFSGTGFKLGPVVGKILGSLATNKTHNYNIKPFSMSRFQ